MFVILRSALCECEASLWDEESRAARRRCFANDAQHDTRPPVILRSALCECEASLWDEESRAARRRCFANDAQHDIPEAA
jgi:hypothetical protein